MSPAPSSLFEQKKMIGKAYKRNLCCVSLLFTQHVYSGVNCEDLDVATFKLAVGLSRDLLVFARRRRSDEPDFTC
jgi:hypothetical protein